MQRLALFDLDNTLLDLDAAFAVWAEEFAAVFGLGPEAAAFRISLDRDGHPHREAFFGQVRVRFGLPDSVSELWAGYRRRMPHLVRVRPEVFDGLARLREAGWKVAIVTNGTADNQLGKIRETGLIDVVDAYALSGLEGVRKPDARLFEIAAQRCGMELAGGGWMVGDNLTADIEGASAVGLRTVWVDRGAWPGWKHEADHVVTDVVRSFEILLAG
ncbi:HAD family hydrolase [Nonomuraea sp. NPDC050328]|uniref:HAD family hydrolase n=1 Tax=Nonomuraea sp. NPDC050328 TaxID=3364361 RepID=UPI00379543F7